MFANNNYYCQYQEFLVQLHTLIAAGRNQSVEARDLRGRMEWAEAHLSEGEIVRLNSLSADLSMIHDREVPDPEVVARVPPLELDRQIESTFRNCQWEEFLDLLRAGVSHRWHADRIAYVRSRAYEGLGELAPAVAFMDEAARRKPASANFRALALRLLWKNQQYQEAYSRARNNLADLSAKSRLILMSGGIVAQQSMLVPEPADLKAVATTAVQRMQQALPLETSPNLIFAGLVALGLLAVQVDDISTAVEAFRKAIDLETVSDMQVTSSLSLNKELEMVQSGQAKTTEERMNARQLVQDTQPFAFPVAA